MDTLFDPNTRHLELPVPCTQSKYEIEALINEVRTNQAHYDAKLGVAPIKILEIGAFFGGTTYCWAKAFPGAEIHVIDDYTGVDTNDYPVPGFETKPHWQSLEMLWRSWGNVRAHWGDSEQILLDMHLKYREFFDFAFIDGDHTYEGVKRDFNMVEGLVRPNGLVAFHDIKNFEGVPENNVEPFWNEVKQKYGHKEFIEDPKWMGIGVLQI